MVWCFMSLSTLFKSYWDDGSVTMTGSVQCSTIQFCLQLDSNSQPCDPMSRVLTTHPPRYFRKGVNIIHVAPDIYFFNKQYRYFSTKIYVVATHLTCRYFSYFSIKLYLVSIHQKHLIEVFLIFTKHMSSGRKEKNSNQDITLIWSCVDKHSMR